MIPFSLPGQWYRGQLHVHSTVSDGKWTAEQVLDWYRARGYHFVALTDHDVLSPAGQASPDFVALGGIEVEGTDPAAGMYHLVGVGAGSPPDIAVRQELPLQEAVDRLAAVAPVVILAHPYWSGQRSADLLALERCSLLEAFNGGCEVDDAKGYSTVHWDDLLAAGRPWRGVAVDDAHWRNGTKDAGLGWVWVKAPALTADNLLDALARGHFYSSSGPRIESVSLEGGQAHVRCSPVALVDFVGNGPFSRRVSAPAGETLSAATRFLPPEQRYLRVAVRDLAGNWAWSNPTMLDTEE